MSAPVLRARLDSILQFMSPYWSWVNCHMVNYLTDNHWQTFVPLELQNELINGSSIDECIEEIFWNLKENSEEIKFPECRKFRRRTEHHTLHAFKDVIITPGEFKTKMLKQVDETKQQIKIKEFLTEKKRHEVFYYKNVVKTKV